MNCLNICCIILRVSQSSSVDEDVLPSPIESFIVVKRPPFESITSKILNRKQWYLALIVWFKWYLSEALYKTIKKSFKLTSLILELRMWNTTLRPNDVIYPWVNMSKLTRELEQISMKMSSKYKNIHLAILSANCKLVCRGLIVLKRFPFIHTVGSLKCHCCERKTSAVANVVGAIECKWQYDETNKM